jgi:hypothetical protein
LLGANGNKLDPNMRATAISLFLAVACSWASFGQQRSTLVKGHRIGETFSDYLIVEKGSAEEAAHVLTDCVALLNNRKERRKQESQTETCQQMEKIAEGETVLLGGLIALRHSQFASQKLVVMRLTIPDDFAKVERDLVDKYSPPDSEEQVRYQNGFGAVFLHPRATWVKRSDVVVVASEDATPTPILLLGQVGHDLEKAGVSEMNATTVEITDRTWAESLVEKERNRPNSLN